MIEKLRLRLAVKYKHKMTFLTVVLGPKTLRSASEEYTASIFKVRACLADYAKEDVGFSQLSWPSSFLRSFAVTIGN